MDRLTGMIALVTGARNGIGKATALALAREGAGLILADCQLGHEFWRTIRVDLFGTLLTCRRVIPEMVTSGGGSIINISSLRAIIGTHGADAYTASKGGVPTMSRAMAVQRAKHSVRVNVLAPGVVLTERVAAFVRPDNPIYQKSLLGPSEPEDVAFLAQFLASDEARKITGTVMCVDGGASIY
ncbi:MAG: SDR family oxidoreductase [Boseongicola sp. SB0667_bin_21]|nr:SDR family oxidoreductase [Boseongicola sp. SB0667_bin_21]